MEDACGRVEDAQRVSAQMVPPGLVCVTYRLGLGKKQLRDASGLHMGQAQHSVPPLNSMKDWRWNWDGGGSPPATLPVCDHPTPPAPGLELAHLNQLMYGQGPEQCAALMKNSQPGARIEPVSQGRDV